MADSLDDFFAKKDKKRKNKNQALSNEALVRELEEGSSKQSEYLARRENKTSAAMELLGLDANDNDWKDFEEVEKRDYTGLKVKEMSIQDQDDEQRRLTEQSEQVPEAIPWKSKQETVAAIISAKNDSNQLASDLIERDESAPDDATKSATSAITNTTTPASTTTSTTTPATTSTIETTDAKASGTDNTDSDPSKAAPSSTKPDGDEKSMASAAAAAAKDEPKSEAKDGATGASNADATKKEGDNKPAASAKKVYVPPHERLEKEYKVLEPTRLSKIRSSTSRFGGGGGARINIENEQDFPSLG